MAEGFSQKDLWRPSFTPEQHFACSCSVGADHSYILDLIAGDPEISVSTGLLGPIDLKPDQTMLELARRGCFAFHAPASKLDHPEFEKMLAMGSYHNLALSFNMGVDRFPILDRLCRQFPDTPMILDHVCHVDDCLRQLQRGANRAHYCGLLNIRELWVKIGPASCSLLGPSCR